jgi:mRNA-degrading endonuclease HigB of HigAB toxin-antitoxin module
MPDGAAVDLHPNLDPQLRLEKCDFLQQSIVLRFQANAGVDAVGGPAPCVNDGELGQGDGVQYRGADVAGSEEGQGDLGGFSRQHRAFQRVQASERCRTRKMANFKVAIALRSWGDLKAEFGSASLVGNCVVFNIGGNKYRLVTRVLYRSQTVYILKVMTHSEYDDDKWKDECGCFSPPPS